MSKKLFQNMIYQAKEVISSEFGLMDCTGTIVACSDEKKIGQLCSSIENLIESSKDVLTIDGFLYKKVYSRGKLDSILFIGEDEPENLKCLSLMSMNVLNIKAFNDDKFNKLSLIKSILTGELSPADIPLKSKDMHIPYNSHRVVFVISIERTQEVFAYEVVQELFPNKSKDFIVTLDDGNIALVRELKGKEEYKEIEKSAQSIIDTLNTESMVKAFMGIGTIVDNLSDIRRSYSEAQTALKVGGIFENRKFVTSYNKLGIGRLIYQLPEPLCRLFLEEVFRDNKFETLDSEYLLTMQKFFENNLNISETSRQMFIHRNTLVYRLDKIQKATGLDITKFDDAIILKFAMLVNKYLDSCNLKEKGGE